MGEIILPPRRSIDFARSVSVDATSVPEMPTWRRVPWTAKTPWPFSGWGISVISGAKLRQYGHTASAISQPGDDNPRQQKKPPSKRESV